MMMRTSWQFTFWSALFLLLMFAIGIVIKNDFNAPNSYAASNLPDADMTQATYEEYDDSGHLRLWIKTPYITHFPEKDTSLFKTPRAILYTKTGEAWQIQAAQGRATQGVTRIFLQGHVLIQQPGQAEIPETLIETTHLTLFPSQSYAETDAPVSIKRPSSLTEGIGLKAYFKTGVFQLLAKSRGQYVADSQ